MNNTTDFCPVSLNATKFFRIPVYTVVLVAGLPLNCLALWALVYQMKRSVVLSVYITNLMLANLLQILMLPFGIYSSSQNHHWGLGKGACIAVGLAFRTNFYAKNSFLCLIAMERYIGLVYPLRFYRLQTMQGAAKVSIVVWLLVMSLCAVGIVLEMGTRAQQTYCLDFSQLNYKYAQFRVSIVALSFFIPCVLMGFFYFRVLAELRKVVSLEKRVKRQIYGFISLIIAAFFLLFTPFQVMLYYRYYWEVKLSRNDVCALVANIYVYIHATLCLTISGNILDPLLYILLLKDVRREFKVTLSSRARQTGIPYKLEQQDGLTSSVPEQMQNQLRTQDVTC
ncbi:G-protein coupled receptor 4-like [Elgaria multicarinata webbii]|uniref:G-protein coupled receptor 4-like n=1 Tax=Elgaria multicarinata webbii TaxID=159646 RepID=UPI002FCD02D5